MAFTFRWLTSWPQIWRPFLVMFALVAALVLYKHGIPNTGWNWFSLVLAGVGGGIGGLLFGLIFALLGVILHAGKAPGLLGTHEYSFVADGLMEKTDANETLIKWAGAHSWLRTDSFLQINIGPGLVHILPRRAFEDHAAFETFCSKATQLVRPHA
jgi:hypothetical protein